MLATCNACGHARSDVEWGRLELVERLARDRLADVVTTWPAEATIEVRRCSCGELMARMGASWHPELR
jgi:hypothetical protein